MNLDIKNMIERKFDFDDISIVPKTITNINSRSEIDIRYGNGKLPLFTAPMSSVVDGDNMYEFNECDINVVLPRTVNERLHFHDSLNEAFPLFRSYGLSEFEELLDNSPPYPLIYDTETWFNPPINKYILIDVANGHMKSISDLVNKAKKKYSYLKIMVGNIANPETYRYYAENTNVDYIRVGIGNGNGCLTTQQTGVGYPKASLINECYLIKKELGEDIDEEWRLHEESKYEILKFHKPDRTRNDLPFIVADGGMKDYSDIIKSLALGADYVMIGSLFNKAIESSGQNYLYNIKISPKLAEQLFELGIPVKKQFYGMSTKLGQKKMGKTIFKTSEGVIRYRKVEFKLINWVENFESYLKSALSYSNANTLEEFIGKAKFEFISESSFKRFNK